MENVPFGCLPFDHFVLENWDATSTTSKQAQKRSLVEKWIGLRERGRRRYFRPELCDSEIPTHVPQDLCMVEQRSVDGQMTRTIWIRTWFGVPGDEGESRAAADTAYENLCFYALQQGDEEQGPPIAIQEEHMYDYDNHDHNQKCDTPDINVRDGVALGRAWSTPSYVVEEFMHCPNQLSGYGLPDNDNGDLKRYVNGIKDTDQRLLFVIADRTACEEGWVLFLGINHRGQVLPFWVRQKAALIEEDILSSWEGGDAVSWRKRILLDWAVIRSGTLVGGLGGTICFK